MAKVKCICRECRWWVYFNGNHGQCRAHSPQKINSVGERIWPLTSEDDGCGEFEPGLTMWKEIP